MLSGRLQRIILAKQIGGDMTEELFLFGIALGIVLIVTLMFTIGFKE